MLTFLLDLNANTLTTGNFSVYFHFQKFVFLWPPSHKWHHKQTTIMFQITKFTLSDRIYPIEYTYIRIEDILWPRQILRVVKVRAIWWGKRPCSFKKGRYLGMIIYDSRDWKAHAVTIRTKMESDWGRVGGRVKTSRTIHSESCM